MLENINVFDAFTEHDNSDLRPGVSMNIERRIDFSRNTDSLSSLVHFPTEELQSMYEQCKAAEESVFEYLCETSGEWVEYAARTMLLNRALEYAHTRPVEHTSNQWRRNRYDTGNEISNMVYKMSYNIYEDTKYDRATKTSVPVAWYVTWDVSVIGRGPNGYGTQIAGQHQKRYTDKAAAEKYLQGRITAYAHLFKEISPPVPKGYAQHFMVNGQLLPGYIIEGQEPERAAAEVSEGGVSASKCEKPSVLGQLAASKAESKAVPAAETPKKERGPER